MTDLAENCPLFLLLISAVDQLPPNDVMRDQVFFRLIIALAEEFLQYSVLSFTQTGYQPRLLFICHA